MSIVDTYFVEICIAGNIDHAKQLIRTECYLKGLCVTVTPTTFIYTGGEEEGVIVRLVNYPRFPSTPEELQTKAKNLAEWLVKSLCQKTALLIAPDKTEWLKIDPPGMRN